MQKHLLCGLSLVVLLLNSIPVSAEELVVAVEVNGEQVSAGEVIEADDGAIRVPRPLINRLHIEAPGAADSVALSEIKGMIGTLDRGSLVLRLSADPNTFTPTVFGSSAVRFHDPIAAYGGYLNYNLHAETSAGTRFASGLFDVGLFAPMGVLFNEAVASTNHVPFRLRTVYLDERQRGDLIIGDSFLGQSSVGTNFPFGGVQWQTGEFVRRRILATTIANQVANPAQVDVFVNGALVQSQRVPAGPFVFENLPTFTGDGNVRVVVRDALGREQIITRSFYQSASLLRQGMSDFSYEGGVLRRNYGVTSFDYAEPFVSGTHRYGITDQFSAEVHGEGSMTRQMAETQLSHYIPFLGVGSLGGGISNRSGKTGVIVTYGFDRQLRSSLHYGFSGARATRDFTQLGNGINGVRQIRERDQALVGIDFGQWGSLSGSIVRVRLQDEPRTTAAALTWNYQIAGWGTLSTTASGNLDGARRRNAGLSLNLTVPFGAHSYATASVAKDGSGYRGETTYFKQPENLYDSIGYRGLMAAGEFSRQAAGATYYSRYGDFAIDAGRFSNQNFAGVNAIGGIGFIDGKGFAAKWIDGSFGVADAGIPGVSVYQDRQLIGKTGEDGRIVIPRMRANEANTISIDPADVSLDYAPQSLEKSVVPGKFSGSVVTFAMQQQHEATITLRYPDGKVVAPASTAMAGGKTYLIGYDGMLYLPDLQGATEMEVHDGEITCHARVSPSDRNATCA